MEKNVGGFAAVWNGLRIRLALNRPLLMPKENNIQHALGATQTGFSQKRFFLLLFLQALMIGGVTLGTSRLIRYVFLDQIEGEEEDRLENATVFAALAGGVVSAVARRHWDKMDWVLKNRQKR